MYKLTISTGISNTSCITIFGIVKIGKFWTETRSCLFPLCSSSATSFNLFCWTRKWEQMFGLRELFSNGVALFNHMTEEEGYYLWTSKHKVCLLKQDSNTSSQNALSIAAVLWILCTHTILYYSCPTVFIYSFIHLLYFSVYS